MLRGPVGPRLPWDCDAVHCDLTAMEHPLRGERLLQTQTDTVGSVRVSGEEGGHGRQCQSTWRGGAMGETEAMHGGLTVKGGQG